MFKTILSVGIVAFLFAAFINLSQAEEAATGAQLFEDGKCQLCHSVEAAGIEAKKKSDKYPDLSHMSGDYDAELLTAYLNKKETINDKKHPMPFRGSDEEMATLVNWLLELHEANKESAE